MQEIHKEQTLEDEEVRCRSCDIDNIKHKITAQGFCAECSNCGLLGEGDYILKDK